jgi:hypothetical protein
VIGSDIALELLAVRQQVAVLKRKHPPLGVSTFLWTMEK